MHTVGALSCSYSSGGLGLGVRTIKGLVMGQVAGELVPSTQARIASGRRLS